MAAGLCPDPLGELKRSPGPLAAIRGPTSKGRGREGRRRERREREGRGREGRGKGGEGKGEEGKGGEGKRGEGEGEGGTSSKVLGGIDAPAHSPTWNRNIKFFTEIKKALKSSIIRQSDVVG